MKRRMLKRFVKYSTPRWIVLLIDVYIVGNTFLLAYLIRFNFNFNFNVSKLIFQEPLVIIAALISFYVVGSYKGIIRHTGLRDAIKVTSASFLMLVFLVVFVLINRVTGVFNNFTIPLSILIIHFLLNTIVLIASRFLFKEIYNLIFSNLKNETRVLIYGAGESGIITHNVLKQDKTSKIKVVGFVDNNKNKIGKEINGLKVYRSNTIDEDFIIKKNISEIIISIQYIRSTQLMKIVQNISELPVKVKIVPPVKDWINNSLKANQIKKIKIEDLLGRAPIDLKNPKLEKEFENKIVLVTGAAGSIGSEIARQIEYFKYKQLILVDQAESDLYNLQQYFWNKGVKNFTAIVGDIRNEERMRSLFEEFHPNLVLHAAAYKHVPFMEQYPNEAIGVNVKGTKIIADLCIEFKSEKFVMISTDKAVNPTNVMGATKRIAEMYINSLNKLQETKFITTRFGNVLGSNGSVIPLFQSQIENGGPLTLTDKRITRYFMTIPEACKLVLEASTMGNGGEIFVFDMGESIKIMDLAINMIHLSGLKYPEDIDIKIVGLRPGEKIKEELLANDENTIPTHHKKIMIAKTRNINAKLIKKKIEDLCAINTDLDAKKSVAEMKKIVPEFISNHSVYEKLDVNNNPKVIELKRA
ncbi:MAG: nucleoside-diphosphate sugar epimerase/dehydratase [Lutibacter sp.]|uniref:polysaccharide biosynthesis protein n=1 Tax=Lutibacter sp. TaxID=1925666 RepID=UPI00299D46B7|nr:nucleoside-diphosphate sugar epimerase/dehydratase [Lutibacter sp.]MDX1828799.1 nucleoside-diphosphate sugar epimerase/dehydratase [Lutibacter sp.]